MSPNSDKPPDARGLVARAAHLVQTGCGSRCGAEPVVVRARSDRSISATLQGAVVARFATNRAVEFQPQDEIGVRQAMQGGRGGLTGPVEQGISGLCH